MIGVSTRRRRETLAGLLFVAPDTIGLGIFVALPLAFSVVFGLFNVNGFGSYRFVGAANYARLFHDTLFLQSLRVTGIYVALFVPSVFCVSLLLAHLVMRPGGVSTLSRTLFFLPNVVGLIVIGVVWQYLLVQRQGVVDSLFSGIGLGNVSWLGQPNIALVVMVVVSVWYSMGLYMIIFTAALQDIPPAYYEAASLEGAGKVAMFRSITWPLLKPTSLFVFLLTMIVGVAGLQSFDLIYIMTQGGPANSTQLLAYYIYKVAFEYGEFGYASAMASVYVAFLLVWSVLFFKVTKGGRFSYADD